MAADTILTPFINGFVILRAEMSVPDGSPSISASA
jgi:hypothetical protein